MDDAWLLLVIAALGAFHGLNPAMGWLFAVGLGMQDRDRRSVLRALPPIVVGHELGLVVVVLLVVVLGVVADPAVLHVGAAIVLIGFGLYRFLRPRSHPRWTRMRVTRPELTWWSFLMSSAHGAGLMLAPLLLGISASTADGSGHAVGTKELAALPASATTFALVLHGAAMLVVMGTVALLVYDRFGLSILRRAWFNVDHVWAASFVIAGAITLVT